MPNPVKYSVSAQTRALKKGNYWIGTGDVEKGPTSSTDYWNGITPPASGYTIYHNKATDGPSIRVASSDSELVTVTNQMNSTSFTGATQCLNYYNTQSDKMVFNADYPSISTNGLQVCIDFGFRPSYSGSGVTAYDLSDKGRNATLFNVPTFSGTNQGSLFFNGTDEYGSFGNNLGMTGFPSTLVVWVWVPSDGRFTLNDVVNSSAFYRGISIDIIPASTSISMSYTDGLGRGSQNRYSYQTSSVNSSNTWINVTMVMTTSITTAPTLYVNGSSVSFPYNSGTASSINWTSANYYINVVGLDPVIADTYTKSYVGIIRTYNRAFTATDALNEFNSTKARYGL